MARLPKWYADTLELVYGKLYHEVSVVQVEALNEKYKKVSFQGDFSKCEFVAGQVIQFRLNDHDFRHYTPSYFDVEKGICNVYFYRHGNGVGAKWLESLKVGQILKMMGPGGKMKFDATGKSHFIFGDETALGTTNCIMQHCKNLGLSGYGILETSVKHVYSNELLDSDKIKLVNTCPHEKGKFAIAAFQDEMEEKDLQEMRFYLTGNAKSIQNFLRFLKKDKGISSKQIFTDPYWVEGKKGL